MSQYNCGDVVYFTPGKNEVPIFGKVEFPITPENDSDQEQVEMVVIEAPVIIDGHNKPTRFTVPVTDILSAKLSPYELMQVVNEHLQRNVATQIEPSTSFIERYLTAAECKKIAEKVFEAEMREHAKTVIQNSRRYTGRDMIHMVLRTATDEIIEDLQPDLKDQILERAKEYVQRDEFSESIGYSLNDLGKKYVNNNADELKEVMREAVRAKARSLGGDRISYDMSKRLTEYLNQIMEV
jgi:hypothetical protein